MAQTIDVQILVPSRQAIALVRGNVRVEVDPEDPPRGPIILPPEPGDPGSPGVIVQAHIIFGRDADVTSRAFEPDVMTVNVDQPVIDFTRLTPALQDAVDRSQRLEIRVIPESQAKSHGQE